MSATTFSWHYRRGVLPFDKRLQGDYGIEEIVTIEDVHRRDVYEG